jgi:hypothetical protein
LEGPLQRFTPEAGMEVAERTEPWKAGCAEDCVCRLIEPVVQIYIFSFRLDDVESVFPKKKFENF